MSTAVNIRLISIGKVYNVYSIIVFMDELGELRKKIAAQDKRIAKLEKAASSKIYVDDYVEEEEYVPAPKSKAKEKSSGPSISFNQVITVLGIVGISIGIISFFFYAIAQGWIGKNAQILIGVLVGFALFFFAYMLHEKSPEWSNVVFGGAYFIEYVSIGVGVSVYEVMPPMVGVIFGALLLISSVALSFKFSSRMIAYFSLVGGFLIPIITDTFESKIFVMVWYLLLLIALSWLSISFDWGDLRLVMLLFITIFMLFSFLDNPVEEQMMVNFMFLVAYFVLFNVASLINSVTYDKEMNGVDAMILGVLPVIFLPLAYVVMDSPSINTFGLVVILFSIVYLIEALYLKTEKLKSDNAIYALVAAGVAALNFGVYFLLSEIIGVEFFIVFFIIEWAFFSYISFTRKSDFYKVIMFLFLLLVLIWFLVFVRFNDGIGPASFFLIVFASVPLIALAYFRNHINYKVNAATFIISGYLFLYSLVKYLAFFIESLPFREIILSVLWLFYTLILFVQVQTKAGKVLVGALLGITLLKIAFRDLLFLTGAYRIVGFIIFGILLLVGGYFLENAKK